MSQVLGSQVTGAWVSSVRCRVVCEMDHLLLDAGHGGEGGGGLGAPQLVEGSLLAPHLGFVKVHLSFQCFERLPLYPLIFV